MAETVAAWIAANTLTTASVLTYNQILVLTYVAAAAATAGIGDYQRRKTRSKARDRLNAGLEDRLVMTATAQAARSRVYGRARNVDGVLFKQTHGANKEFYTLVVAVAGHEVDGIETVYFNEQALTLDGSGYVQTPPFLQQRTTSDAVPCTVTGGAGSVTLPHVPIGGTVRAIVRGPGDTGDVEVTPSVTGSVVSITGAAYDGVYAVFYQYTGDYPMARVRAFNGGPGQNLYSELQALVGSAVQVTDRFEGVACLLVTLQYDQDAFPAGVPQISAVMRGARVYDPRSSTTAFSANPALIARDWSLYANGGGCVTSELVEPAFVAAANACDTSTTFSTPAGAETRPLYQCGIVLPLDGNPDDGLSEICESMAGQWGWAGGRLSVRAGAYRAPVATITEDWVTSAQDITILPSAPTADAVNVMRPTLADAAQGYVTTPAAEVRAAAYVTADGRELAQELQLGGVNHAVHAQHVCGVLMREAREGLVLTLPCNLRAYELELFDAVTVVLPRFGWGAGKLFEVVGWQFSMTGGVLLTLHETAAAIYTPDASFDVLTTSPNTGLPRPQAVPALAGLAASSNTVAQQDGSSIARVAVQWTASTSQAVLQSGRVEVQYTEVLATLPAGDWPAAPPAAGNATRTDIYGARIGVALAIRARFVNTLGMRGPWSQIVHVVNGRRAPVIYRQASAPTTGVQDGDEWIDTDDGNKRHVREAGAWVAVALGTGGIAPNAATEIITSNVDHAGAGFGTITAQSFTHTPAVASIVEFSAKVTATNILGDSGSTVSWWVTPSGGSALLLGGSETNDTSKREFTATNAFAAAAGLLLTFELRVTRPGGNPSINLYNSYMRATVVKR